MNTRAALLASLLSANALLGCARKSGEVPAPPVRTRAAAQSEPLRVGDVAPDFEAVAHRGEKVHLAELRGKAVVLYFYPKDGTPGCSAEADAFKTEAPNLERAKAVVLGVSSDDAASHRAFADEHGLPFLLLPDTEHVIADIYGVGTTFGMMRRVTFLIAPDGRIAKVYPDVTPSTHAAEVVRDLTALSSVKP